MADRRFTNLIDGLRKGGDFKKVFQESFAATPEQLAAMQKEYAEHRRGYLTTNVVEAGAFLRTDASREIPDIQCFFLPYLLTEAPSEAELGALRSLRTKGAPA